MRSTTLALALLGLLFAGAAPALAQGQPATTAITTDLTAGISQPAVTLVRWSYGYGPGWYGYYRGPRYYTYSPYYYYGAPQYYEYAPVVPYTGYYGTYYYPYTGGYRYVVPRRSFYYGF
jgi:hypothetical protein